MIQRLQLAVWPDNPGEWKNIDRWPDADAKERAFTLFQRLDELPLLEPDEEGRIAGVHFDDEGQEIFDQWRLELESKIRQPDIHPAIEAHLTKYRSLMPSLALILNECDIGHLKPVTAASARKAAAWCTYLEQHAYRIYGASIDSQLKTPLPYWSDEANSPLNSRFAMSTAKDGPGYLMRKRSDPPLAS